MSQDRPLSSEILEKIADLLRSRILDISDALEQLEVARGLKLTERGEFDQEYDFHQY